MNDGVLGSGAPSATGGASRPPIRLALLDEHRLDREAFTRWVERNARDFNLVVAEDDWTRLVRHPAFPADVVVIDADPVGPVSLAARVRACRATGSVVVLLASGELSEEAAALGVEWIIRRPASVEQLVPLAEQVRAAVAESAARRPLPAILPPRLSAGELRALRLYAAGATTAEVAQEMGVGYETVKTYLRRVRAKYAKLGRPAGRRSELVRRAAEDGILD